MPHESGRPWIIAHRGASAQAPENTLEAFRLAAQQGADAVELDIRRTADGTLVVHHGDTLTGSDRPIIAMSLVEALSHTPSVPRFSDALAACEGMWVDVEIKNDPGEADWDPTQAVVASLASDYADANIVVTSFNHETVIASIGNGFRAGWLIGRGIDPADAAVEAAQLGCEFVLPHFTTLNGPSGQRIIDTAAHNGVEVAVWTVDDPLTMTRLTNLGVGGIATNRPDIAAATLR
jgi:glycerophosphoryl diester phosphodiesterase